MKTITLSLLIILGTFSIALQSQTLLHHYPIDSGTLLDVAGGADLSGVFGETFTTDRTGAAFSALNTSASPAKSPTVAQSIDSAFTLAAWIFIDSPDPDMKVLGYFDSPSFSGALMGIMSGMLDAEVIGTGQPRLTVGSVAVGTWTHVAVTWDLGDQFIAYIDGVNVGSVGAVSTPIPAGFGFTEVTTGSAPWDVFALGLQGSVDDLRVYDYALSSSEVAVLAGASSGCDASVAPDNVTTTLLATTVRINWDAVASSVGCRVDGSRISPPGPSGSSLLLVPEIDQAFIPYSFIQDDSISTTWEITVTCACSTSPLVITPASLPSSFTVPAAGPRLADDADIKLYPNPSQEQLSVSFEGSESIKFVEILNVLGQIQRRKVISSENGVMQTEIFDVSQFPAGIYFLRIGEELMEFVVGE
jgi:hypothetical protein